MTLAPASSRIVIALPCRRRPNGHWSSGRSLNVRASIATTATPFGCGCVPRTLKRASIDWSSSQRRSSCSCATTPIPAAKMAIAAIKATRARLRRHDMFRTYPESPQVGGQPGYARPRAAMDARSPSDSRMEPSRRTIPMLVLALVAALMLLPAGAQAASLHVVFPQTAEVTVVQGASTNFTLEVQAFGATRCDATTAPVVIDTLYSVDAVGDTAAGVPADMPIETDATRGVSDNCDIKNPVEIPLTAT